MPLTDEQKRELLTKMGKMPGQEEPTHDMPTFEEVAHGIRSQFAQPAPSPTPEPFIPASPRMSEDKEMPEYNPEELERKLKLEAIKRKAEDAKQDMLKSMETYSAKE